VGKESSIPSEEYNGGREWISLLSEGDRAALAKIEESVFSKYLHDGYEIVWTMGTDSGRLLREGPFVSDLQEKTAGVQIKKMRSDDFDHLAVAGYEARKRGSKSPRWWDNDFWEKHRPHYFLERKAVVPPQDWKMRQKLSIDDIKVDDLGITILVKKDSVAKRSKIFS
jgi:hypothetical protein